MLPTHLIPQLSPTAAKLYLAISTLTQDRRNRDPDLTLKNLCRLCAFSRSTCLRALRQLRDLKLVLRVPDPSPPEPQPRHTPSPNQPPRGTETSPMTPKSDPEGVSPMTPPPPSTLIFAPKTPTVSPMTPQLTSTPPLTHDAFTDPAALRQCLATAHATRAAAASLDPIAPQRRPYS